jgi:hypothetical protein
MRPNCPPQIAHRLAASFQGYRGLLRIVASYGPCVGGSWCSPLRRRTSRRREEPLRDRNDLPSLAVYRDIVSRSGLSCAVSQRDAISCFAYTKAACRGSRYVVESRDHTAAVLNLFARGGGHAVTCNRLFPTDSETKGIKTGISIVRR